MTKRKGGLLLGKRAQATLELALSFIVLTLFLLGAIKTTLWFGNNLGGRAQYYNAGRTQVAASPIGTSDIGYQQTRLSFFGEGPSPFNTLPSGDFDGPEISAEYTEWVAQLDALRAQMSNIYADLRTRAQRVQVWYEAWRKSSGIFRMFARYYLKKEAESFRAYSNNAQAQLDALNQSIDELSANRPELYASESSD